MRVHAVCVALLLAQLQCSSSPPREASLPGAAPASRARAPGERRARAARQPAPNPEIQASSEIELLHVATWNLRRLGHGTKRLDRVAAVIARHDVVALQEVMKPEAVEALLERLPGWKAAVSPRAVGRGAYAEWYAVLYRAERVRVEREFMAADPLDAFAREPFVVCMKARSFDFCLVNIHVVYGREARKRDDELRALAPLLTALRSRDREKDWILAGDFNRAPRAKGWAGLRRAGWSFAAAGEIATSLGKNRYSHAYDHICVDRRYTVELARAAARFDLVAAVCGGDFARCSRELSDHAPMSAHFVVNGSDDD